MIEDTFSIYIHFPWCVKKCYYCDFNSHAINKKIPEQQYIARLLIDFDASLQFLSRSGKTRLTSIFFGGGTPSLLSAKSIATILNHINKIFAFPRDLEITLEVNPGAVEQDSMYGYKTSGITRVSVGAQSFQDDKLKILGRVHKSCDIKTTLDNIIKTKFNSFNIDLMYGLPNQNINDALYDLNLALSFSPPHLSWYQLTMEQNTWFYHCPPVLPDEDIIWEIYNAGLNILANKNYINYEISAFAKENYFCRHNLNYWQYGDYLGIGPGAHSKITNFKQKNVTQNVMEINRLIKIKNPKEYLDSLNNSAISSCNIITKKDIIFEFMLNNLRLQQGFLKEDFLKKTSCQLSDIQPGLNIAISKNLLAIDGNNIKPTLLGRRFLNNLQELFV